MAGKSSLQIQFEEELEKMSILIDSGNLTVDEHGVYTDDQTALLFDVYSAGYDTGNGEGYQNAMLDYDSSINPA